MSYSKSVARKSFESATSEILTVIRAAHSKGCKDADIRRYVLCNATVMCSARMEAYLEDLITEWISRVNSSTVQTHNLPAELRAHFALHPDIREYFRSFILTKDEPSLLDKMGTKFGHSCFHFVEANRPIPHLDAALIYEGKTFPTADNLKVLFKRIGVQKIFSELKSDSRSNLDLHLKSFNNIRNEIAHTGIPPGINDSDIRRHIREMQRFVYFADKIMYKHVCKYTGSATWPS